MEITESAGYKSLLAAVEKDEQKSPGFHDHRGKMQWAIDRAQQYAEKTDIPAADILSVWESHRNYWYMNFYQERNQPQLTAERARIFDTVDDLHAAIGDGCFRCPRCGGISKSPYVCDSGQEMDPGKICDWKVYGLFGDLGKGIFVFVKEKMYGQTIFMPLSWEHE